MKKQDLLKIIEPEFVEKLFGFCYARTSDSHEAQDLCSDIVFALVKAANTEGDVDNVYPFAWQIARHVYADFCERRKNRRIPFIRGIRLKYFLFIQQRRPMTPMRNGFRLFTVRYLF